MRKLKKVNRHSRSVQQYAAGCVNCNSTQTSHINFSYAP